MTTPALTFLAALLLTSVSTATVSDSQPISCTWELISMSACIPYMAAAPINVSASPSAACCKAFAAAATGNAGGGVLCLCHLVRNSSLYGFPLNEDKLTNLSPACGGAATAGGLGSTCQGVTELPKLDMAPFVAETGETGETGETSETGEVVGGGISGGPVLVMVIVSLVCVLGALNPLPFGL